MSNNISLDAKIEYKGYWYLPSDPDNAIAGIVAYLPNERITLELFGGFDNSFLGLFVDNKQESVIYGKTSDAKEITLLQCNKYSSLNSKADFPIVRYDCDYMIIGKHINGLDEKCKYWASVTIPELTYWCHPEAIMTFWKKKGEKENSRISFSFCSEYQNEENIIQKVQIDNNTSIDIVKGVNFHESEFRLNTQLNQYTYIEIHKEEEASIVDFLSDIFLYEQFLSLATLKVVNCSGITLFDKELYQEYMGQKNYRSIEIIHPFFERNGIEREKIQSYKFLFDYSGIKEIYPAILKKWYNEPLDIAPIRNHLISSLEQKRVYSSVDFLIIIQAIEGFYRRFRSAKYRKEYNIQGKASSKLFPMLQELVLEFSDIDLVKKKRIDIEAVVDSRIYYSHFMPKSCKLKAIDGWELFEQTKKLRILLLCCVLSLIGFNHVQIDNILKTSNSNILKIK